MGEDGGAHKSAAADAGGRGGGRERDGARGMTWRAARNARRRAGRRGGAEVAQRGGSRSRGI